MSYRIQKANSTDEIAHSRSVAAQRSTPIDFEKVQEMKSLLHEYPDGVLGRIGIAADLMLDNPEVLASILGQES